MWPLITKALPASSADFIKQNFNLTNALHLEMCQKKRYFEAEL